MFAAARSTIKCSSKIRLYQLNILDQSQALIPLTCDLYKIGTKKRWLCDYDIVNDADCSRGLLDSVKSGGQV